MVPAQPSILVLEDEPAILRLVTAALHGSGYENVFAAANIREARQIWADKHGFFDLFLTDFSLPDGSAIKFIHELRGHKPDLSVLMMSGFNADDLGLHEEGLRDVALVQKPFRPSELCEIVAEHLRHIERAEAPAFR